MKKKIKEFKIGEQYTVRQLQEFAVAEMYNSIPEHKERRQNKFPFLSHNSIV